MSTVSLDAETAAFLTAHALDHVSGIADVGCCPGCCAPCGAIHQFLRTGELDDVVRGFASERSPEWWVAEDSKVHRLMLARAWETSGDCPTCYPESS